MAISPGVHVCVKRGHRMPIPSEVLYRVNLSSLYRDAVRECDEGTYMDGIGGYFSDLLSCVRRACRHFFRWEVGNAGARAAQLEECVNEMLYLLESASLARVHMRESVVPLPDLFFHPSTHPNHILRVLAPDADAYLKLDVLFSVALRLVGVFPPKAIAQYAVDVVLMQCLDFARDTYTKTFTQMWREGEDDSGSADWNQSATGDEKSVGAQQTNLLSSLFLTHLFENGFNRIHAVQPPPTSRVRAFGLWA